MRSLDFTLNGIWTFPSNIRIGKTFQSKPCGSILWQHINIITRINKCHHLGEMNHKASSSRRRHVSVTDQLTVSALAGLKKTETCGRSPCLQDFPSRSWSYWLSLSSAVIWLSFNLLQENKQGAESAREESKLLKVLAHSSAVVTFITAELQAAPSR